MSGLYAFRESGSETFDNRNALASTLADTHILNTNYAAFGEGTFDLIQRVHLTGGLRWTEETKRFRTDQLIGYQGPQVIAANPLYGTLVGKRLVADNSWQEQPFRKWTPRFTAAADLNDDATVYATWSKGFKSGSFDGRYVPGFNPSTFSFVLFDKPNRYEPEELTLYEGGLKYTAPSRALQLRTAVFRSEYKNLHVPYVPPGNLGVSYISNAAQAVIEGAETEFELTPLEGLTITGGGSYLDAHYTRIDPVRVVAAFPTTPHPSRYASHLLPQGEKDD